MSVRTMAAPAGPCASAIPPAATAEAVAMKPRRDRSAVRLAVVSISEFGFASLGILVYIGFKLRNASAGKNGIEATTNQVAGLGTRPAGSSHIRLHRLPVREKGGSDVGAGDMS